MLAWSVAGGATVAATPAAITGPVTSVGPTTATVTGTVNPNGQATTWYVEYGTSTSYGTKTANVNAGSGTANAAVSASSPASTPGTTYHYRVVATNSAGTARGADGIFTTSAAPVAVTGAATSVTSRRPRLNGTVDPNGRATMWYFEYGTSTSYGSKTAEKSAGAGTSTASVSGPVSGLTTGAALPLPPRRDERCRHEPWLQIRPSRRPVAPTAVTGVRELDRARRRRGSTAGQPPTGRRRPGTSSTGRARATARRPLPRARARGRARSTSRRR